MKSIKLSSLNLKSRMNIYFNRDSVRSLLSLWTSQLFSSIFAYLTQVILARTLSLEEYGALSTAFSVATILANIAGFGVGLFWVKVFGEEGIIAYRWLKSTILISIISSLFSIFLIIFGVIILDISTTTKVLMLLFTSITLSLGLSNLANAIYMLESRFKKLALYQFLNYLLRFLVVIIAFLFINNNIYAIGIGYSISSIILIAFYSREIKKILTRKINIVGRISGNSDKTVTGSVEIVETFKKLFPYGLTGIFFLIYSQSSILLLASIRGEGDSGLFNVAITILSVVYLFPAAIANFLLPKIVVWNNQDKFKVITLFDVGNKLMLSAGLLFMGILSCVSIWIIPFLFGDKYISSADILIVLSIAIPFRFLGNNIENLLVTQENMSKKVRIQGLAVFVNVLLNVTFIYLYGLYGAAIATVITEFFITGMYFYVVKKNITFLSSYELQKKGKYLINLLIMLVSLFCFIYLVINKYILTVSSLALLIITCIIAFRLSKLLRNEILKIK